MNFSEKQFDKLEARVEKLDDKVDVIKDNLTELRVEVKAYTQEVVRHVGGDDKVIVEIMPTLLMFREFCKEDLPQIKEILLERKANMIIENKVVKTRTATHQRVLIVGGVLAAISTAVGLFFKFFQTF